ncbi:MAG: Flp pilus assembly protein CpaB [Maritimibacter sp.]|nr:Flp pilus assembly protein CpaB [Maritimibacter sp.]
MRSVFILVLVLGVGLAGFAVYMAKGVFGDYQAALAAERAARSAIVKTVDVYVVNKTVRYGDQITEDNIRQVAWPETAMPKGVFTSLDTLFPEGEKQFRTALRTMEENEPILAVKVTKPGEDAGVASRLSDGMRAFAIKVDVTSGVSGFLTPGDRVDVYWTGRTESNGERREVTKLIQTNLHIIAIDQTTDIERTGPSVARTITVEGTPDEVARLNLGQLSGRLTLALVGHGDETVSGPIEIDHDALLGIEREVREVREQPQVCSVTTNKGGERVVTQIPCPTN